MLMTTMFLGAIGVAAPEPVHAAGGGITVTANYSGTYTIVTNASIGDEITLATIKSKISLGTVQNQKSIYTVTGSGLTKSNDTTLKITSTGDNIRVSFSEKIPPNKSSISMTFSVTQSHTHSWTDASYSASGNKITATCQGSGTCPLTKPTLTLNASDKTYDGSEVTATLTPNSTWTSQGLGTPTINYSPANSKNAGTYTASVTKGNATASKSFTISQKEVGLLWGANTFTYDGQTHIPTVTATGLVSGESCSVTAEGAQTNAGTHTATATGLSNSNYKLPSSKTKSFTINPKAIDLTGLVANEKDYDGNKNAIIDSSNASLSGVIDGDNVSFADVTGEFADKNAGTNITVTATTTLTGSDAGNYTLNPIAALQATIHKIATEVNGIKASDKEYDGTTDATVDTSSVEFDNMVDGDDLTITASGEFEDANVGKDKTVNLTLGSLGGADAGNYILDADDSQQTATASITPKEMTVSASGYEDEWDGDPHSISVSVADPADGYTITYKGPKDSDFSSNNPAFTDPGTYEVTYKVTADNYAETTGTATVKIIEKDFENITSSGYEGVYDGENHSISVTVPDQFESHTISYSTSPDGEYSTTPIEYKDFTDGAQTVYFKVSKTGYNDYTGSKTVNITQKEVTLNWGESAFTYNGEDQIPTVTADGLIGNDACDVTVTGEQKDSNAKSGITSYTATATGLTNNNYKLPANATKTFTINQKEVDLEWGETELTYNGKNQKPEVTATGMVDGEECNVVADGAEKDSNAKAGVVKYTATVTGLSDTNYKISTNSETEKDFTIAQKEIKVSGIKSEGKVYDGYRSATNTLYYEDAILSGKVDGDGEYCDGKLGVTATGTFDTRDRGTNKTITLSDLTLTGSEADNYVLASTGQQATTTGDITQYQVNVTAENKEKFYGEDDPEFTYTHGTIVEGDYLEGSLSRHEGEEAGEYTITAGTLHDHNHNYAINFTHGTLTIKKATQNEVTASIEGWTYGDDPNEPGATATFGADTASFTYSKTADGDYSATVPTNAGTWYVKATVPETSNYVGAVSEPVEFEIEKKEVGLNWGENEFTYNGNAQKPAATATGLEDGDECNVTVSGEQVDSNAKSGTAKYTATAASLSNPNYKLPENKTKDFTIAQAEITVSGIAAEDKTYDGNTDATLNYEAAALAGKVDGEDVSVTATGTFGNKNAGKDKTVTISELALAGDDAGNYVLAKDQQEDTTASINKKPITVTAEEKSKYFGDSDPELTYTVDPALIDGDSFSGALARAEGEDVGDYVVSHGSLTAGDNYAMHYVPATFEILQASNSVTAAIEGWTYGEEANEPTATAKFGADKATFTYSDAADGDYSATVPTEAGTWYVKATVPETDNYKGAVSEPVEFEIEKKTIDLEWSDTALTYNGKAQKPKATAIGLVGDDECEVIVGGEQTDSNIKTVTDCYIATATGLDNGNYKLPDEVTCEFTIAPKDLTQAMLSLDSDVIESDGTQQGPEVTLTDEDIKDDDDNPKQLIEDDDYSLSGDVKTSKLGTHVVAVEGKGNYTGTLETSWVLVKEKSNADTEKGVDGAGDINIFVSVEGNTETITVDNFTMAFAKSLLTEEDLARRDAGEDITLYVEVIEESSSDAPLLDRTELQALFKLKSAKDIRWFDIKVWKKIGNDAAISIHELKSELMMSINVPDEHKNAPEGYTRTFYFGTAHNGSARIIEETADTVIVFGSKEFSTYALAYKDTKIPEPDPDDSDTGDNGNGSSSSKGGAKTGDSNDIAGLMTLMLASACALGVAGYRRRKETDK